MKKIKYFLLTTLSLIFLGSCESIMDKRDLGGLLVEDLWQEPALLKGFMDNVMYTGLPPWEYGRSRGVNCDELYGNTDIPYDELRISEDYGWYGIGIDRWNYPSIRKANMFLENVDKCPEIKLPVDLKNQYIAQIKVLRAWLYFEMVRSYGGVPLVLNVQRPDDDVNLPRSKTSECIDQIIKDLDDAIKTESFPMKWTAEADLGRLSKAIAYALKARVLLYYASPQFSKETPGGTKPVAQRWTEAYNACKEARDKLAAEGFGLFRPNPANAAEAAQNYQDMFSEANEIGSNPEMVWVTRYRYPLPEGQNGWDNYVRDGYSVPLEFTNAFANADGSPYTGLSIPAGNTTDIDMGTTNATFWANREPRFYASIAWNGAEYPRFVSNPNPLDLDASGKMKHQWAYRGAQAPYYNSTRWDEGSIRIRKMCDPEEKYFSQGIRSGQDWPLIRYAEVLLNFAEAAAKTGHEDEALQVLRDIRKRAGIPLGSNNYGIGTPSGDNLILTILKERQVELAYEAFRFWDLRRWRLYTDELAGYKLNGQARHHIKPVVKSGVTITNALLASLDIAANPASYFDVFENHIYSFDNSVFRFSERQYFYRIRYDPDVKSNPNMQQTILWENGTFNPYE